MIVKIHIKKILSYFTFHKTIIFFFRFAIYVISPHLNNIYHCLLNFQNIHLIWHINNKKLDNWCQTYYKCTSCKIDSLIVVVAWNHRCLCKLHWSLARTAKYTKPRWEKLLHSEQWRHVNIYKINNECYKWR